MRWILFLSTIFSCWSLKATDVKGFQSLINTCQVLAQEKKVTSIQGAIFQAPCYQALEKEDQKLFLRFVRAYTSNAINTRTDAYSRKLLIQLIRDLKYSEEENVFQQTLLALSYQQLASNLIVYTKNTEQLSLRYFLKAEVIYKRIGYDKTFMSFQFLSALGEFYYRMREYGTASKIVVRAEKYVSSDHWNWAKINFYNTAGLSAGYLDHSSEAISYYQKGLQFVDSLNVVWQGLIRGNMALEYNQLGQFQKAYDLSKMDLAYSRKHKEKESEFTLLCTLSTLEVKFQHPDRSKAYLDQAKSLLTELKGDYFQQEFLFANSYYLDLIGEHEKAFDMYRKAVKLKMDFLKKIRTHDVLGNARVFEAEIKAEYAKRVALEKRKDRIVRWSLLSILLLGSIGAFLFFRNRKLRELRRLEIAGYRRELVRKDLELANKELDLFKENMLKQRELLDALSGELDSLRKETTVEEHLDYIRKLNEYTIVTQQDWVEFSHLFDRVYPDFIARLKVVYPSLTANEVRLLVLAKLEYSTKEMAAMLGVTLDAIHKGRYRLRKKLNLPEEDNFSHLLAELFEI